MKVNIIVDSTCDLSPALRSRVGVVPLTVRFGDVEYVDGVTLSHEEFYEKLVETDALPRTSQAIPADFAKLFEPVAARSESAVVITVASTLSGTFQSARIAASVYDDIYVVDSGSAAIGAGILTEYALRLADEGLSAAEIAARLEEEKQNVRIVAMVDTLEYLQRGGRISKAAALAGGLLGIKPVIALVNGEIKMLGKARGSRQAGNLLMQEIEKAGGVDFDRPVLCGYTGLSDALLKKYIADSAALWHDSRQELTSTIIGSVIGTHAGPGAIATAFFRKK